MSKYSYFDGMIEEAAVTGWLKAKQHLPTITDPGIEDLMMLVYKVGFGDGLAATETLFVEMNKAAT